MNEFKAYHPSVNFIYFVFVISFSCFFMHGVCLLISFVSSFIYSVVLNGTKRLKVNLLYTLPAFLIMACMNPLFNHEGASILFYLPSGNCVTMESVIYGIFASIMIICVIFHFSCYNSVMTSDKFIYLFGRVIPSLSLVISMALRFVPRFASHLKEVINTQKCMGRGFSGGIIKRIKSGISILSSMITYSLENAVDTSDSMKSRGYGLKGRTTFSIYTFSKRDKKALVCLLFLGIYVLIGALMGECTMTFFPYIKSGEFTIYSISVFFAYFLLCMFPIIIEIREVIRWKV